MAAGHALSRRMKPWLREKDPGASGTIRPYGAISYFGLVTTAAQSRTLARPTSPGQICTLHFRTDGGDLTLTVTGGYDEIGSTTLVFNDAGQIAQFTSVETSTAGTFEWRLTSQIGAAPGPGFVAIPDGNYTILAANSGKTHVVADVAADRTYSFPPEVSGLTYTFVPGLNAADGHDWIFDTGSDTNFFTGGVTFLDSDAGAASDELSLVAPDGNSNSKFQINLPEPGTTITFICNGTTWNVSGIVCSATAPVFADQ